MLAKQKEERIRKDRRNVVQPGTNLFFTICDPFVYPFGSIKMDIFLTAEIIDSRVVNFSKCVKARAIVLAFHRTAKSAVTTMVP